MPRWTLIVDVEQPVEGVPTPADLIVALEEIDGVTVHEWHPEDLVDRRDNDGYQADVTNAARDGYEWG